MSRKLKVLGDVWEKKTEMSSTLAYLSMVRIIPEKVKHFVNF